MWLYILENFTPIRDVHSYTMGDIANNLFGIKKSAKRKKCRRSENDGVDESLRVSNIRHNRRSLKVRFTERKRAANGALFDVSSRTPTHAEKSL